MSTLNTRLVGVGLFFLFIFLSGFWLSRTGRPYGTLLFTVHKLIALAVVVVIARSVYQTNQAATIGAAAWSVVVFTGLFFISLIVSGALLSIERPAPTAVMRLHHIAPYLAVLSTATSLYLLLVRRQ